MITQMKPTALLEVSGTSQYQTFYFMLWTNINLATIERIQLKITWNVFASWTSSLHDITKLDCLVVSCVLLFSVLYKHVTYCHRRLRIHTMLQSLCDMERITHTGKITNYCSPGQIAPFSKDVGEKILCITPFLTSICFKFSGQHVDTMISLFKKW